MRNITLACLLLLSALSSQGQDTASLPSPWPPPANPADAPFAKMTARSYASYKKDGVDVNPVWGDLVPNDFGPRQVNFDFTGLREVNQVPAPGVHPRILCTPADLPDIQRRLKETRCGQEMWKNLLCYVNFMKGTYDPKADYAQPPVSNPGQPAQDRVVFLRVGFGSNEKKAAQCYQALIKGDTSLPPPYGMWAVFGLEAFRCWVESDAVAGHDLAAAVMTSLKIDQARRDAARKDPDKPFAEPVAGIQLAYIYDFLFNYLSPEQKQTLHDQLATSTWNHDNYGSFNEASHSRSNWATFSFWLVEVLAIEGEPGFNDLKVRGMYRGWRNLLTYGWFPSGATYEGEAKDQLGMDGILAFSLREKAYGFENLVGHPFLRAYATSFLPKSVLPTRDGFIKYDLLGGCHSKPLPSDMIGLKYLLPHDPVIDWIYRSAVGEHYENLPNSCVSGSYDAAVWGGYFEPMIPFLIFASDFDPANDDPGKLGISNTFFAGERALILTRSSWDRDGLLLGLHVRQANGGHPYADRNSIMVAGSGRVWAPIYGWGFESDKNVNNSEVVIDDHPQSEHAPARLVDFSDQPQATFAVGDAKYAWDWNWKLNETWGALGAYTMDDYKNNAIKVETAKGWEFENHSVNDFSYTKNTLAYLNQPLATQPDWVRLKGCITPIVRQPNYPVLKAIRTAGLVRGPHPYALVVDDIQKDDQAHDYTWYMTLEHDVQIAQLKRTSDHEMDLILTGSDPAQVNGGEQAKKTLEILPPVLDSHTPIPAGQPMLLLRFLNATNTAPDQIQTEAKEPTILQDPLPNKPMARPLPPIRRLAVPVHAVSPDFKVLIYAYRQGQPLPTTAWSSPSSVTVAWPDQQDRIEFSPDAAGKTNLTVTRGSDLLISMNKPLPPPLDPPNP